MARRIGKKMRAPLRREIQRVLHAIDRTKGIARVDALRGDDGKCCDGDLDASQVGAAQNDGAGFARASGNHDDR